MTFTYPRYGIRIYKFHFKGFEKPLVIEALCKRDARQKLIEAIENVPQLYNVEVESESVTVPINGETTKMISSEEYVWENGNWIKLEYE